MSKNDKPPVQIGIIGDALAPNFNEAYANQIHLLSEKLKVSVLTGNNLGLVPLERTGCYLIMNTRFLRKKTPFLSLINGAFFYPLVKLFEKRFDTIFLTGSIDSGFLNYLNLEKCILIINTLPFDKESEQTRKFVRKFAPKMRGIIAQSKRIRNQLIEMDIKPNKVGLIYPWVDLHKFKYSQPPDMNEFQILFASAPNDEIPGEDIFTEKGIPLLLEAFKEFTKHDKVSLTIIWRGAYHRKLVEKIKELDLESRLTIVNEVADMPKLYSQSHITVIPFLNTRRSPEIPLSAVESLACGRPVVTTDVVEIAEIVDKYRCGYVAKPVIDELVSALVNSKQNYMDCQVNCRRVAEELFSLDSEKFTGIGIDTGVR